MLYPAFEAAKLTPLPTQPPPLLLFEEWFVLDEPYESLLLEPELLFDP
jgi:hypothetical protein